MPKGGGTPISRFGGQKRGTKKATKGKGVKSGTQARASGRKTTKRRK